MQGNKDFSERAYPPLSWKTMRFIDRYEADVYAAALTLSGDINAAQDITETVFVELVRRGIDGVSEKDVHSLTYELAIAKLLDLNGYAFPRVCNA